LPLQVLKAYSSVRPAPIELTRWFQIPGISILFMNMDILLFRRAVSRVRIAGQLTNLVHRPMGSTTCANGYRSGACMAERTPITAQLRKE
jgi:hypothetical protein